MRDLISTAILAPPAPITTTATPTTMLLLLLLLSLLLQLSRAVLSNVVSGSCTNVIFTIPLETEYSKVVPYSTTSVGHGAHPGFLAVSPQVTLVINPVVGSRYFPLGPRLLSQPERLPPPLTGTKLYCLLAEAHRCK